MFERFTERARQTVVFAQQNARNLKHAYIGTEHIVLGILEEAEGMGAQVLIHLGLTYETALDAVQKAIGEGPADAEIPVQQLPLTPRAKKVYELALREALSLGNNYIGTEHVLLGLVRENEGAGARILREAAIDSEAVRDEVIYRLSGGQKRTPKPDPAVVAIDLMRIGDKLQSESSRVAESLKGEKLPYEVAQAVWEIEASVKEWTDARRKMVVQRAA